MIHHTFIPQSDMPQIDTFVQSDTICNQEYNKTTSESVTCNNHTQLLLLQSLKAPFTLVTIRDESNTFQINVILKDNVTDRN